MEVKWRMNVGKGWTPPPQLWTSTKNYEPWTMRGQIIWQCIYISLEQDLDTITICPAVKKYLQQWNKPNNCKLLQLAIRKKKEENIPLEGLTIISIFLLQRNMDEHCMPKSTQIDSVATRTRDLEFELFSCTTVLASLINSMLFSCRWLITMYQEVRKHRSHSAPGTCFRLRNLGIIQSKSCWFYPSINET